jgi:ribosomal protein S27AE
VVLPSGLSDQDLTAALARVYQTERFNPRCGGVIFAYHDVAEFEDLYTVGRLIIDGPDQVPPGAGKGHVEVDGDGLTSAHVIAKFDY